MYLIVTLVQNNINKRAGYRIPTMNRHDNHMANVVFVIGWKVDNEQMSRSVLQCVE